MAPCFVYCGWWATLVRGLSRPAPCGSGSDSSGLSFVQRRAAATCAPSCATGLASDCASWTAVLGNPGRGQLTLHLVALVSSPSLCWIATAPFISFDGEKGFKLEMKRVAAFAEVDDDAGSLFDYDVDRVRVCRSCSATAGFGEGAVLCPTGGNCGCRNVTPPAASRCCERCA